MIQSLYTTERPPVKSIFDQVQQPGITTSPAAPITAQGLPNTPEANVPKVTKAGQLMANYGSYLDAGANAISAIAGSENKFITPEYTDKAAAKDQVGGAALTQVKDTVAASLGPLGMAINSGAKIGDALGQAIGGDAGAVTSSLFAPDKAILSTWNDPDLKTKDKVVGTILPFYGALKSKRAKERRKQAYLEAKELDEDIRREKRIEADQRMEDGLQQLENLKALQKQQLGYISSNY